MFKNFINTSAKNVTSLQGGEVEDFVRFFFFSFLWLLLFVLGSFVFSGVCACVSYLVLHPVLL